jgi:putative colanic acid biosysnthesis UDP-glucose lipid carrier transferase
VAVLIKMSSKGPIFFKQKRHGLNNKLFDCLKFRTMKMNDIQGKQASKDDPRITSIGKILRKTSIDEFPQFINVLLGDMSVVGPRPHFYKHNEEFAKYVDGFMTRHMVKPGVTGLAQTRGYRGETNTLQSVTGRFKLDRFYIENWTFGMDLKITFKTFFGVFLGDKSAY